MIMMRLVGTRLTSSTPSVVFCMMSRYTPIGSELKYSSPSTHTSARAEVWHRRAAQFHTVHLCVMDAMESRLGER